MEVGDELAVKLGIPGVETVRDYYRWYHERHDKERKERIRLAKASCMEND